MIEILGIAIGGLKAFGDNSLRGRRWHEFDLGKNNKIKSNKNKKKGFLQISMWTKFYPILTTWQCFDWTFVVFFANFINLNIV